MVPACAELDTLPDPRLAFLAGRISRGLKTRMMASDHGADIAAVQGIAAVPRILEVCCRTTGMGFAAVARVTEDRWVACAVRDEISFGLTPGGELKVETTICTRSGRAARPSSSTASPRTRPFAVTRRRRCTASKATSRCRSSADGSFFGTLCAIDPRPAQAQEPADHRHVQAVRRADQLPCRRAASALATSEARAVRRARRSSELREQFIAVLGHDLRNPLASIDAGTSCWCSEKLKARPH